VSFRSDWIEKVEQAIAKCGHDGITVFEAGSFNITRCDTDIKGNGSCKVLSIEQKDDVGFEKRKS